MAGTKAAKEKERVREEVPVQDLKLTELQQAAVKVRGKNVLVSAGAGTGKTRVLVERFLDFVINHDALVPEILALTFTDKAANEMKSRIRNRLQHMGLESSRRALESSYISTIHAFAARLLREHPLEAQVDPDFRVIEPEEADLFKEMALDSAFETRCERGNDLFEFVRRYGENRVREGVLEIFHEARHEGLYLREFFERYPLAQRIRKSGAQIPAKETISLFQELGETELAGQLQAFVKAEWSWQTAEEFKEWQSGFSKKRDKKGSSSWQTAKDNCKRIYGQKLNFFLLPCIGHFEKLALCFEELYETSKKDKGFLDFDDLQIRAVRLFEQKGKMYEMLRARYQKKFRQILVDEFQDTNLLQLKLIELLATNGNVFYVGDFKQSVYAFRGAEPSLFLNLEDQYRSGEQGGCIDLLENFRTAAPTLDFINRFFSEIWQEDDFVPKPLISRTETTEGAGVELMTATLQEDEETDVARMREADAIAAKIHELREQGTEFGRIAVLFQAMTKTGIYEQALKNRGIPYYLLAGGGFYHQPEIRDMISFLSFLENPLSDIPLAAAMRSPMFQVKDNTLYWLSRAAKGKDSRDQHTPLYHGFKSFESLASLPEEEKDKLRTFTAIVGELMELKDRLKISELLDMILARTSYELTMLADAQGVRRYANLKKLISLAREFENHEPLPLGAFLRTVRRLEVQEIRESEAQIEAEASGDVVRLMTVHKAKGLEFDTVFIADLGREKRSALSTTFRAKAGQGYSFKVRNEITLKDEEPGIWREIHEAIKQKEKEEWKRLFYVAATRAKRKLILSGVRKERKKAKESYREMATWMDWVEAALPGLEELIQPSEADAVRRRKLKPLAEKKAFRDIFKDFNPVREERMVADQAVRESLEEERDRILSSIQPLERAPARTIDLPVSAFALYRKSPLNYGRVYEIGHADQTWEDTQQEKEWTDEEISAADFGTAVHHVLERIDFRNPEAHLEELLENVFRYLGQSALDEARNIVQVFLKSRVYEKLKTARTIRREIPFVLNERHGLVYGVLDVLFCDDAGKWHILDYKTATGSADSAKASGYDLQIALYAHAVHRILEVIPASGMVYYLKNDALVTYPFDAAVLGHLSEDIRNLQEQILSRKFGI